jgi:uncharacterized protein YqeY
VKDLTTRTGKHHLIKGAISLSILFLSGFPVYAGEMPKINGVLIPESFAQALYEGISIPVSLHLDENSDSKDDQRIGNVMLYMDSGKLVIRQFILNENNNGAVLSKEITSKLESIKDSVFEDNQRIQLSEDARLKLNFQQLYMQLIIKKSALGTVLRPRASDIGASSVDAVSSTLDYRLGLYNSQSNLSETNTSSFLALNSVTAFREHHIDINGSVYGAGSNNENISLYKAMYERDFAGRRFAAGMLDSWNLQSLGPVTAISSSKIYGMSYGNNASSTVFDNSQSLTPIVVFLPSAGEIHVWRDGRLLSVQNFPMGSHEINTGNLPYGNYSVDVEVVINGKVTDKRSHRVNKLFSPKNSANGALSWQFWGGMLHMDPLRSNQDGNIDDNQNRPNKNQKKQKSKDSYLLGTSASGNIKNAGWAVSAYTYDQIYIAETRLSIPFGESVQYNVQSMLASDSSKGLSQNVNISLPGGFSSLWANIEKSTSGNRIQQYDVNNRSIGGTLSFQSLTPYLGTLTASYNNDAKNKSHYYNVDYNQNLISGRFGTLSMRTGVQHYNNNGYNPNTGKYVSLDFSLPMGNSISAGISNQGKYTTANISATKEIQTGPIRTVGANVSRTISGNSESSNSVNAGTYARFDSKYSSGTVNINSSANGRINSSVNASGSLGWQGKNIAMTGRNEGNAGIIINTGIESDGMLNARIDGRSIALTGKQNYVALSPYSQYNVEITNHKNSAENFDIKGQSKNKFTLYPGNVAVISPEIQQRVTVSGRIKAEDGSVVHAADIKNPIGRTKTDNNGEFVMDVDKKFPIITLNHKNNKKCEIKLDISQAKGAAWVGDIVCSGLKTYAKNNQVEGKYES